MRRLLIALTLTSPLALLGCEDGPDQPFSPAPPSAATNWNNGNTPGYTDPSTQPFDGGNANAATNKQDICDAPTKKARWAEMSKAAITPPFGGGNINLAGGRVTSPTWKGITIEEAEDKDHNCQSEEAGDVFGDGTPVNYWGDQAQVWFAYSMATRKGQFMEFFPGYTGKLEATAKDLKDPSITHNYLVQINQVIKRDNKDFWLEWDVEDKFTAEVDELGYAFLSTYAPTMSEEYTKSCTSSRMCIWGVFGDIAYLSIPLIGLAIWSPNINAAQPTPSTPDRISIYLEKVLPFSLSYPMLKLDAEGPTAQPTEILNKNTNQPCILKFGVSYGDFLNNCVRVTGNPALDDTEENKLLGGFMHGREQYHFDLSGIDVDFAKEDLAQDKIIADTDRPVANDLAREFTVNQSLIGKIVNDRKDNDLRGLRDNHGVGLVYLEYARIVQAELNKAVPHKLQHGIGDLDCLAPAVDPANPVYPDGCTGFEGFVTCAPKSGDPDLDRVSMGWDPNLYGEGEGGPTCLYINNDMGALGLKPGHPSASFCVDPTGDLESGWTNCVSGDIWSTSFARVLEVLGQGRLENLPYEIRDTRFFYRAYFKALAKYMMVAGTPDETVEGVHNAPVVLDELHFDSAGAGQWETAAYIDRRFANDTTPPVVLTATADIKNGIFNDYTLSRQLFRGERLMHAAVWENKNVAPAKELTTQLTNIFGSPVLRNGWFDTSIRSAWECATADPPDPDGCDGQYPPLDENGDTLKDEDGMPILYHYKGAFGSSASAFALGTSHIKLTNVQPFIASVNMTVPVWENPYDETSAARDPLTLMVPYEPKQPGLGYRIPMNGQLDKFIPTYHCDLSGTTISLQLMWDWTLDENKEPLKDGSIDLLALHADDFLGDVFLCQDSATGDLLRARMYTTTDYILDWLIQHPAAIDECQIIIRYSPFGNFPDYISSLTNGVTIGVTQGGGKGRVVDAELFVPGQ